MLSSAEWVNPLKTSPKYTQAGVYSDSDSDSSLLVHDNT